MSPLVLQRCVQSAALVCLAVIHRKDMDMQRVCGAFNIGECDCSSLGIAIYLVSVSLHDSYSNCILIRLGFLDSEKRSIIIN